MNPRYPNECKYCKHYGYSQNPYSKKPLQKSCDYAWSTTGDYTVSQNRKCNSFTQKDTK